VQCESRAEADPPRRDRGKCSWPRSATGCRMSTPWEQLISSTMTPTTAVAVKLAVTDEPPEPTDPNGTVLPGGPAASASTAGGIFGTLHRHIPILSRLSNKSDKAHCRLVGNYIPSTFPLHAALPLDLTPSRNLLLSFSPRRIWFALTKYCTYLSTAVILLCFMVKLLFFRRYICYDFIVALSFIQGLFYRGFKSHPHILTLTFICAGGEGIKIFDQKRSCGFLVAKLQLLGYVFLGFINLAFYNLHRISIKKLIKKICKFNHKDKLLILL